MIPLLIVNIALDGVWLVHFVASHRTGVTAVLVGAVGWVGNRTHIPTLATHSGGHRPPSRKVRKALRRAHKASKAAIDAKQAEVLAELNREPVAA